VGGTGAELDLDPLIELRGCSGETGLFGEGPGGILLTVDPAEIEALSGRAADAGIDALRLGRAGGDRLEIGAGEREIALLVADAEAAWRSLESLLSG
jgi:hypothetical protein